MEKDKPRSMNKKLRIIKMNEPEDSSKESLEILNTNEMPLKDEDIELGTNFSGHGPKGYIRSDERVFEDVCETLMRHREIDATNIAVKVEKGVVTLSGRVLSRRMKKLSQFVIETLPGVEVVRNELSVIRGINSIRGADAALKKDLGLL
jgi:hypothetical protein